MKKISKYLLVVPVASFLLCGCKTNNSSSEESKPANTSIESESNWEEMITNGGLFTSEISFEIEDISENDSRVVLQKDDNRFKGQYFWDGEANEPNYFSYDKNSRQEGNVYTWTIYGEHGETINYPLDGAIAEFMYPFFFKKSDLTYDSASHSYKADAIDYTLRSDEYTFHYHDVEMKFENGALTYVEFYREDNSSSPLGVESTTLVKEEIYIRKYGEISVTLPQ